MAGKKAIPVTLKMTLKAKYLLIEEYPLSSKYVTYDGEYWWFKGNVKDLVGVGRFYMGLTDQIVIIDSFQLKQFVKTRIENLLSIISEIQLSLNYNKIL